MNQIGGSALPHILEINPSKEGTVLIGVFNDGVAAGDIIYPISSQHNYEVLGIIEKRNPKGNWTGDSYKGKTPQYYRLQVLPIENQIKKQ